MSEGGEFYLGMDTWICNVCHCSWHIWKEQPHWTCCPNCQGHNIYKGASTTKETLKADEYFDAHIKAMSLENDLFDALLDAAEIPRDGDWPLEDCIYDYYDSSFEFLGVKDDWKPSRAQRAAFWKLGFNQCWICYTDGTERFYSPGILMHPKRRPGLRGRHASQSSNVTFVAWRVEVEKEGDEIIGPVRLITGPGESWEIQGVEDAYDDERWANLLAKKHNATLEDRKGDETDENV